MNDLETLQLGRKRLKEQYTKARYKKRLFIVSLVPLVVFLALAAVSFGSADIGIADVYQTLFRKIFPHALQEGSRSCELIIWKLRLPRICMGLLAGLALGGTGAVMQVILRNPLADPYMLGISSAAGFGASLAIINGAGILAGPYLIIGNAFLFSLGSSALILMLSARRGSSPQTMVLLGLAMLFFFQAMTTILQYFGNSDAVKAALFWTVGDLGRSTWKSVLITLPIVLLGEAVLIAKAGDLNIMNSGDASAKSLGVQVQKTRIITMVICAVMIAAMVSFTGTIGFIGLVAPHIVRMSIGSDNRFLIPASAFTGAALLVVSDTIARTILSPAILPVGSVTAFLGVPLFMYLILRKKGSIL